MVQLDCALQVRMVTLFSYPLRNTGQVRFLRWVPPMHGASSLIWRMITPYITINAATTKLSDQYAPCVRTDLCSVHYRQDKWKSEQVDKYESSRPFVFYHITFFETLIKFAAKPLNHYVSPLFHHEAILGIYENFPQNPCRERNLLYFYSVRND